MATVKITNGFPAERDVWLTGTLIEGDLKEGDKLILNQETAIPIIDIEVDKETLPGKTYIRLKFSEDQKVVWHKLFEKEFTIENTAI